MEGRVVNEIEFTREDRFGVPGGFISDDIDKIMLQIEH